MGLGEQVRQQLEAAYKASNRISHTPGPASTERRTRPRTTARNLVADVHG